MTNIYNAMFPMRKTITKKILVTAVFLIGIVGTLFAQNVNVTATAGTLTGSYPSVKKAFDEINNGTHQGVITVTILANTNEGSSPAVLNSSDASPASYTSVSIRPNTNSIVVTGDPAAGFAVIELNGADNVTIDGDNPNTGGVNRNLTVNNTNLTTDIGNSCIRIATSGGTLSANNITIKNCILNGNVTSGNASGITSNGGSSFISFGIFCGGRGGTSPTTAPTAISTGNESAPSGTTINSLVIDNNQISQCARGIVFNGSTSTVSSGVTITNNEVGDATALGSYPYSSPATTVYAKGIFLAGTNSLTVTGNTIRNILSYLTSASAVGIELSNGIGTGAVNISNNTITGVANNSASGLNAAGILVSSIGAAFTVSSNTVSVIENAAAGQSVAGLTVNAVAAPGTISSNIFSKLFAHSTGGAYGIQLANAANGTLIQNNFIFDIMNAGNTFGNSGNVDGILLNAGSGHKVYHNSISLYGVSAATASSSYNCLSISSSSQVSIDIRNNIFSNEITGGFANSVHVGVFLPFAASAGMDLIMNNNAYYTGVVAGVSGMAYGGSASYNAANLYDATLFNANLTTPATNWRSFSSALGNSLNDNYTFASTGAAPFTSATNLHIPAATLTALESGGTALGVTTDIDAGPRNALTPDIGADEFVGVADDNFAPVVTVSLPPVCGSFIRTLTATITDATGVPTSGLGLPVLYWFINGVSQPSVTATWVSGSQYTFTFGGGVAGNTITYYIVTQDAVTPTPNVIAFPTAGATGYTINPPAVSTAPTTPYSYVNQAALAGPYNVGVGQTYTTLTAAVTAYNSSCLSGAVTFLLVDANYPSETYPITINANPFASSTNTLTIKPNTGVNATISGNDATAIFKLNGADYVTIDGSNNGTTSVNLTITNTNAATTAATMWIASASTTNGATNNTIKNCNINGSASGTSIFGIVAGGGVATGDDAAAANSNNTISGNTIKSTQNGIYIIGKIPTGFDQNWVISNNTIGSSTAGQKMGFRGIFVAGVQNFSISGNTITGVNVASGFTSTASGISVFDYSSNGNIFNNKINDIKQLDPSGFGANGIYLGSDNTASNITVYNNFIWDVTGVGFGGVLEEDNGWGIMVDFGGGYNIYYNSINMATSQSIFSSITAAINISSAITTANSLNIRNNIFANTETIGTRYAIYSGAAASVYSNINNNDYYYSPSPFLGFLGTARSNLPEWQTATGKDANSISVIPSFTLPSDLHLTVGSALNAMATPIGTITTDIDAGARSVTTPDIGADEFVATTCGGNLGGTAISSISSICGSGQSAYITASGFSTGGGISYQWEVSPDGSSWGDLVGQTNPYSAFTGILTATRYYRLRVTCVGTGYSTVVNIIVSAPTIVSSAGATRCGTGTVNLTATGSASTTLNWYDAPTGGALVGTGSPFTTPIISATTNFYVAAQSVPITYIPSLVSEYVFSTSTGATLDPMAGATVIVSDLLDLPTGTDGDDNPSAVNNIGFTFNFNNVNYTQFSASPDGWILLGGSTPIIQFSNATTSTTNIPKIYPYWDDMSTGSDGNVKYLMTGTAPNRILKVQWFVRIPRTPLTSPANSTFQAWLYEGSNKIEFRYGTLASNAQSASVGLTASATNFQSVTVSSNTCSNSTAVDNNAGQPASGRMYVFTPKTCESPRTMVTATSTTAPAITATVDNANICEGSSATLNVTSGNPNYTYQWMPGSLAGATQVVSPIVPTTYTVTATDPGTLCAITADVTINVNTSASAPLVSPTPDTTICAGGTATLTATPTSFFSLVKDYQFTTSTGATLDPMVGATTIVPSGAVFDDVVTITPINIGFNFNFNNINYSQFFISSNGWIMLGAIAPSGSEFSNNVTSGINNPKIYALWDDWVPESPGNIIYTSTGTAPNRILRIQYFVSHFDINGTPAANTTFQVWLYEGSNKIEFRYGAVSSSLLTASVGLTGSATNFLSVTTSTNTASNVTADNNNTTAPASGRMYTFTPFTPTLTWSPALGLNTTTGPLVLATPAVTTIYSVKASNPIGCGLSSTTTVIVQPTTASVSIAAVPPGPICAGTSVTFTATPTNGGVTPGYQWYNGATPIGGQTASTYTTTTLVSGDVITVRLTSGASCAAPGNPYTSNAISMTVNPSVAASVSIAAVPAGPICSGTSVTFTATPTNGGAGPTYQWYNGVTPIGGQTASTYTSTTLVSGDAINVHLTSNAACVTGSPATSNTINMTVNPNLPASVSIAAVPSGTICSGTSVTFTATPTNGGASPTYQWYVGATPVGSGPTFTSTTLNDLDAVSCVLTSNAVCATGSPATSNIITMDVNTGLVASVTIASSGTFCAGNTITFTATPVNGGTPTYQWYVGAAPVGAGLSTYSYVPANGDLVKVEMTTSLGCAAPATAVSNIIPVNINASPIVTAAADCNNILPLSGQNATLTATASAPGPATITNYQWLIGGSPIGGANAVTYATNVAGSYTVTVTNSNGCSTTSSVPVVITTTGGALAGGTYNIPSAACNGFDKISTAVTYINTHGIAGPVIFAITPAYAEIAPVGGYAITATGTSTNTITFQRNGAGANPVITAGLQTAGSNSDGIFKIIGGDYITIENLTLQENTNNIVTTAGITNTMTEWGIALLYANTTNGPNNNTIQNNTISLNKAYPNSFAVYSNMRHAAGTPGTGGDITNTTGGSNKVYGNAISNVNNPIAFIGSALGMPPGNDIGGSSALTANTITNWGSNTGNSGSSSFYSTNGSVTGIYAVNQTSLNISWNSLTSAVGINVGAAGFRGINIDFMGIAPIGTFTNTVSNNTLVLNSAGTTGAFEAITSSNTFGSGAVAGVTINLENNTISSALTGVASSSVLTGIANAFPAGVLSISGNILKANTSTATTAGFLGISNTGAVSSTININNNQFGDAGANAITFSAATNGAVQAISNSGAAVAANLSITGNTFTKFVHSALSTSPHTYIAVTATTPATQNINTNSFNGITTNSNGALTCINSSTASANKVITGNTFTAITGGTGTMTMISSSGGTTLANIHTNNIGNNIANTISGAGTVTGISTTATGIVTVATNTITGLRSTGSGFILSGISTATATSTISANNINTLNITAASSAIYALTVTAGASTMTGNNINTLTASGNASGLFGIITQGGTVFDINQNTINGLTGTGTGAGTEACGIALSGGGTTISVSKNKIYNILQQNAAGSGTTPIVTGLKISADATGTNTTTVSNNFISDLKAPAATISEAIHAIRISTATANRTYNVYYNSVYLNASGAGNFGTAGLFHTGNAASTTSTLNLRNNIIDNESTPLGTGKTVAFRRGSVLVNLVNYASTSNNNSFYAGAPGASNLIFSDGTNFDQTLAAFQTRVSSPARDVASVSAQPSFISATDLRLNPTGNCEFEGGAAFISGFTDDIEGDLRDATYPDIGGDEFAGSGGSAIWKGRNTNWEDPNNWCGVVPTSATNVVIPTGRANYPIIVTATPVTNSITIIKGANVTITGIGKLSIYGAIVDSAGLNVVDGTIEMRGASAQTIPLNAFQNADLKNLIINNASVTLAGKVKLYGKLSFVGSNRTFATADSLVLRSTAAGTASVGDITNNGANSGNQITGDVSVERFNSARRAWRFLSVPTQNNLQTIHEAWQENQPANNTSLIGYGIHITKDSANWNTTGFDLQTTPGPSMKYYVPGTGAWKGITSTINAGGSNGKFITGMGYMVLVRGDRQINYFPATANTTVLRDKGALYTGDFTAPVGAGQFAAIGNPYASAIDFSKIPAPDKVNIAPFYYLWDPYMGTLGAYVTFATSGTHTSSTSYGANYFIESGQAFFVNSSGPAGSIKLSEPIKVDGSNLVSRPTGNGKQLKTNLYQVENNERNLYDAVVSEFDGTYAASVDALDAIKMTNFGENFGIMKSDKKLSIERMPELVETDTIFYNLNQMRVKNYQFEFIPENMGQTGLAAFLEDRYLNVKMPVSFTDTSRIDFSIINDPGSYAADRFRLVFLQAAPVPVTFSSIRANRLRNDILVEWKVENELNIARYELEKSANGVNFSKVNEQTARGNGLGAAIQYNWLDTNPLEGDNFYRVRSVGVSNEVKMSQVVKVNMGKLVSEITVFPNPVREDGIIYVSLNNKPAGNYQLNLVNSEGQTVMKKTLNHAGGNSVYSITMDKFAAHGNYLVNITGDNSVNLTFKIVY